VSSVAGKAFYSIQDRYPPATIHGGIILITALVPEPILQAMAPGLVADFRTGHPQILKKFFFDQTRPSYNPVRDSLFLYMASGPTLMSSLSDLVCYSSWQRRRGI
jgi:hypothetical protein